MATVLLLWVLVPELTFCRQIIRKIVTLLFLQNWSDVSFPGPQTPSPFAHIPWHYLSHPPLASLHHKYKYNHHHNTGSHYWPAGPSSTPTQHALWDTGEGGRLRLWVPACCRLQVWVPHLPAGPERNPTDHVWPQVLQCVYTQVAQVSTDSILAHSEGNPTDQIQACYVVDCGNIAFS